MTMKQNLKRADQPSIQAAVWGHSPHSFRPLQWLTRLACLVLSMSAAATVNATDDMATGDQAWAQRHMGQRGSQAAAEPIQRAIDAYAAMLNANPGNLEARWKLLRALHFKGEFVLNSDQERLALYQAGREVAEAGRLRIETEYGLDRGLFRTDPARVASAVGYRADVAGFCFWGAANWGLWGQYSGKMISALTGLVNKIRQLAEIMVLMDESIEKGGAHRLLGHFHARVPRIPMFTWWVDRDLAISELRLSLKVAPHSLLSKIYLAEALLKFSPAGRQEALGLLQDIVKSQPDPQRLVEDTRVIEDAGVLLKSETG